jgi:hypothetical protein
MMKALPLVLSLRRSGSQISGVLIMWKTMIPQAQGYPYSLDRFQEAGIVITLEKNGRAKITLDGEDGEPLVVTGRWDFRDSNRRIEWRWDAEVPGFSPAFNLTPIYRIRQLREDQLHLTSDDERFRFHLEPFR